MALILPAVGEVKCLEFMLGKSVPGNQSLRLYINSVDTTDEALTAASLTQMSTLGYAAKTLTKTDWVVATSSNVGLATYAEQTWTFTGGTPVTVYGYYVVDSTTGILLWVEAFGTAKTVTNVGDIIRVTPKITLSKI